MWRMLADPPAPPAAGSPAPVLSSQRRRAGRAARRVRAGMVLLVAVAIAGCGSSASPSSPGQPLASGAGALASRPPAAPPTLLAETVPTLPPSLADGFRVHAYEIVPLPLAERPYSGQPIAPVVPDYPADADGFPTYERDGRTFVHPVVAVQRGLTALDSYAQTHDDRYLARARLIADRLVAGGVTARGGLWFPYPFDFPLHGKAADLMEAPWYSAMAQGQVLSLLSRLHELTHDDGYLADARRVFRTIADLGPRSAPWVSWVDKRYLWLEEYPGSPPDHTLNGFLFALFGVYDYHQVTGDPAAAQVFRGGLTTIRRYLPEFRRPGGISRYCLLHGTQSAKYHGIHISQLRALTKMTGDPFFADFADLLEADHP